MNKTIKEKPKGYESPKYKLGDLIVYKEYDDDGEIQFAQSTITKSEGNIFGEGDKIVWFYFTDKSVDKTDFIDEEYIIEKLN